MGSAFQQYTPIPIECPNCHAQRVALIQPKARFRQKIKQTISCVKWKRVFEVRVAYTIASGPFPATG